jgi:hypothetical protein
MPTPSLILVPARFKTGKLYTPVATTSGGLVLGASGDFNVTRATTATRVNASGLIESVASGIPRLDYFASGGVVGCPALLVEPQAQNIMAQSETLSVSGNWSRTNVLVSGGVIASPDGLASGTLIVATSGSAEHKISRGTATAVASGAVVTTSCFFKAHGTNNFAQLVIGGFTFSPALPYANFSLSGNGAITTGTYSSAFIENYGNGWYRCGFTVTAAASGTPSSFIVPIIASGTTRDGTFAGNGNGVYAWGFQVETGSVATSYIPTTTAAVTRNADVINVSGAVSGCIGQSEGTFYVEFQASPSGASSAWFNLSDGTANNWIFIGKESGNARVYLRANNVVLFSNTSVALTGGVVKAAVAYKTGDFCAFVNGNSVVSGTTAFTFSSSLNRLQTGAEVAQATNETIRIRAVALYTTRLTNAQLAALTTP